MYDLIIVGGGPAGISAGVYAARKRIKTLLLAEEIGGQSIISSEIQNWIGVKSISGYDLAKSLEEHLRAQDGTIEIVTGDLAAAVEKSAGGFRVKTKKGQEYETKYLLLAAGSHRRRLGVPGEKEFEGKGVYYCSICDAPLFPDKTVAVVGGGNAGLEAVRDLDPYAKKIYVLVRSNALKGDPITQEKVKNNPKVEVIYGALTQSIMGKEFVSGLTYQEAAGGGLKELALDGVFVEIGAVPNSDMVKGLVNLNERGEVVVDHKTQRSSDPGIWAAGDVADVLYKQNNISAGDAIKAVLNIYETIHKSS